MPRLQVDALKQRPQLVVATPGRLLDLIDDDDCSLTLGRSSAAALHYDAMPGGQSESVH